MGKNQFKLKFSKNLMALSDAEIRTQRRLHNE